MDTPSTGLPFLREPKQRKVVRSLHLPQNQHCRFFSIFSSSLLFSLLFLHLRRQSWCRAFCRSQMARWETGLWRACTIISWCCPPFFFKPLFSSGWGGKITNKNNSLSRSTERKEERERAELSSPLEEITEPWASRAASLEWRLSTGAHPTSIWALAVLPHRLRAGSSYIRASAAH